MRVDRAHPTEEELQMMDLRDLARYAKREEEALREQKQTAVPRLLKEMRIRMVGLA